MFVSFLHSKKISPQEVLFEIPKSNIGQSFADKSPFWRIFWTEISKLDPKHGYFNFAFKNQTFIFPDMGILQYALVSL